MELNIYTVLGAPSTQVRRIIITHRWLRHKESACNAGDWVQSLGWEDSLEKEVATHSSIFA